MRKFLIAIGALAILAGVIVGGYAIKYYTADVRGRVEANEQIKNGSNRIAQYDKFFNQCAAIQGLEGSLDSFAVELAATTNDDDRSRILANITGVSAQRSRSIAQYNADARKNYTDGQFRDSDLPYQISDTSYPKGGGTSCGNS